MFIFVQGFSHWCNSTTDTRGGRGKSWLALFFFKKKKNPSKLRGCRRTSHRFTLLRTTTQAPPFVWRDAVFWAGASFCSCHVGRAASSGRRPRGGPSVKMACLQWRDVSWMTSLCNRWVETLVGSFVSGRAGREAGVGYCFGFEGSFLLFVCFCLFWMDFNMHAL